MIDEHGNPVVLGKRIGDRETDRGRYLPQPDAPHGLVRFTPARATFRGGYENCGTGVMLMDAEGDYCEFRAVVPLIEKLETAERRIKQLEAEATE